MKRRYRVTLAAVVVCCLALGCAAVRADTQADLDAALKKIDTDLYKQSEADLRAFLDGLIETYWRPGGKDFGVSFDCGGQAVLAPMLLRAYEMLGDEKYKKAGLDFADALLQIQRLDGLFPSRCVLRRGRKSSGGGGPQFEDEHNFVPFAIVVYAYKVSGDEKYMKAARRYADMVLSIQDPAKDPIWRGGWPLAYSGPLKPPVVHVTAAAAEPASMTLKARKEREITLILTPKDATCKTAVWTSSDEAVARVVPRMLDKIDPKATRPHYRTGGKLFVVAGKAGKATITATTTDGHHRTECKVTVAR